MEDGHYLYSKSHEDDTSRGDYALHLASLVDAANSALHQQAYEVYQGQSVCQPESSRQPFTSPEETMPIMQASSYLGSTSASAPLPYPFMRDGPFHNASAVEQRMFGEVSYLTEGQEIADFTDFRNRRRQKLQPLDSAMNTALLNTFAISNSSVFHPVFDAENSMDPIHRKFHAPDQFIVKNSELYNQMDFAADGSAEVLYDLKRITRSTLPPSPMSPSENLQVSTLEPFLSSKRSTDQTEHIIRERQRRDDMTSKFALLESLLPPTVKRDRTTVVEDTIIYVKNLHQRINALQERRLYLKSLVAAPFARVAVTTGAEEVKPKTFKGNDHGITFKELVTPNLPMLTKAPVRNQDSNVFFHSLKAQKQQNDMSISSHKTCVERVQVHLDLPRQLVVEMTCRPHAHIHSQIMQTLENLSLDVLWFSITWSQRQIICLIVAKPRVLADSAVSGDDVKTALKYALIDN